jgi:PAP2 superfamily
MTLKTRALLAVLVCWVASSPIARADAVTDWNAIVVKTVSGQNPFAQARFAAIVHLAVFEAVNAVTGDFEPYLGNIQAPPGAAADAAAVVAAHTVLRGYFPAAGAELDQARAASLSAIPDGPGKLDGIAVGEEAAAAVIALRANDGSAPPEFHLPGSSEPGEWQPTGTCPPSGGVLKHWRNLAPFGIESAEQFRSEPPPALMSRRYARDFNEVKEVGSKNSRARPGHLTDVARFYNSVLAVATWNPVLSQVAASRGTSLSLNARLFALLNMGISDALVSVMETKYHYSFWRPETAIRRAVIDGNPRTTEDPAFEPFIPTPCFPSYGSAHAAASYAARSVLEKFFGELCSGVTLSSPAVPGVVLEYGAFEEITEDIDDARVYGGIHFRFDQRAGARQGRRIGTWVVRHNLRPARPR